MFPKGFTMSFPNKLRTLASVVMLFVVCTAYAGQHGHKITGTISGYHSGDVYLSMLYGGNQYLIDTATSTNGNFVFDTKYHLESGIYLIVLPPSKSFLLMVTPAHEDISFNGNINDLDGTLKFDNSPDNTAYYDYLRFFREKRTLLDKIKSDYDAQTSDQDKVALLARMQQLKKEVVDYQTSMVARADGSLTAAMIKCELPVEIPAFEGSPEQIQFKKYMYQKNHFFDNIDLTDERLIRAPRNVLVDRVEYYMDHLTPQNPDSINASVDFILSTTEKTTVAYRFFLTHLFNKYREAKKVGMDGVYVHIAEKYIASGKAPWIEDEEKNNVLAAVKLISPTLIGKKAPNFSVQLADGKDISLYDVSSPYTVLFFWSPNCAHCQKSMPTLNEFYKTYKKNGVEIFAVCTKLNEQEKNCWEFLEKNNYMEWINASDQEGGSSSIHGQYNLKVTPKIYILGKDKTIIAKDLSVENLEEVMKRLLPTTTAMGK